MPTYGLSVDGFLPKTFDILVSEMNADLRAAFGESINLTNGVLAKLRDIVAERYAELWEKLEEVNSSQDPDKAMDTALEALCALTGTIKRAATASVVILTLTGTPATVVNTASRAVTESTLKKFATVASGTIALVPPWAPTVGYIIGQRVNNGGNVYQCTVAGTSAGAGGPTGTGSAIVDNLATWHYLGAGTGAVDVVAACTETGAIAAVSGDIIVIDTPVGGWQGVINILDATLGRDIESNEDLRVRREMELAQAGTSTQDAIRAALLEVADVTAVTVFTNNTDVTDADGIPPHAVECLVQNGDDQDILDAIFANVAAGVATSCSGTGAVTGTVVDSQGTSHTVKFTRPTNINVYATLTVLVDAEDYPADGDLLIKEAIVTWGDAQKTGKNVVSAALIAQAFTIPGVIDVTVCNIGTAPAPGTNTTIQIALRELAVYDTSRISVSSSTSTP